MGMLIAPERKAVRPIDWEPFMYLSGQDWPSCQRIRKLRNHVRQPLSVQRGKFWI